MTVPTDTKEQHVKRHGTRSKYVNDKCRCVECTAANTAYQVKLKARLAQLDPAPVPHGLNRYENYGCRCVVCRAAKSEANADQARRRKARAEAAS